LFYQFYILDQSALASDVTEIHEKIDMLQTSTGMAFKIVQNDVINNFGVLKEKMSVLESNYNIFSFIN